MFRGADQNSLEMKSSGLPDTSGDMARSASLFDIVNGFFKIDAVKVSALKVEAKAATPERHGQAGNSQYLAEYLMTTPICHIALLCRVDVLRDVQR